jgi:hypothetical protein
MHEKEMHHDKNWTCGSGGHDRLSRCDGNPWPCVHYQAMSAAVFPLEFPLKAFVVPLMETHGKAAPPPIVSPPFSLSPSVQPSRHYMYSHLSKTEFIRTHFSTGSHRRNPSRQNLLVRIFSPSKLYLCLASARR